MDVVCNIDDNYTKFCGVMLTSLFENNRDEDITVHVLGRALASGTREVLTDLVERKNKGKIAFYHVENMAFPLPETNAHISVATYYRLFMASLLPESLHKVLYLDCDLLVVGSLKEYWNTDITRYAVGVVEDMWAYDHDRGKRLGYPSEYSSFNAGVMLINLDYWRAIEFEKKAVGFIEEKFDVISDADQDVLNGLFYNQKLFVPFRYNLQDGFYRRKRHIRKETEEVLNNELKHPVIIHFTNRRKPWKSDCIHPLKKEYFRYLDMTVWKGERPAMSFRQAWKTVNYRLAAFLHLANGFRRIS